ncbi:hypothetical protein PUG42_19795 [Erwiniaceae bacterium L1_54_3]|nr:hypothetical protein [Erwiniaceae bacterium L1_54_3]
MKFAYFYASSPEIEFPEMLGVAPMHAILSVQTEQFPSYVDLALNVAIIEIISGEPFWLDVKIYHDGKEVKSTKDEYQPFRRASYTSSNNDFVARYSFLDNFLAEMPGTYTFIAKIYEGATPKGDDEADNYVHQAECSIVIAKEWR